MKRPPHKPGKRRQYAELVWLGSHAGFSAGQCYGWLQPEPEYILREPSPYFRADGVLPIYIGDTQPCMLFCPDRKCQEWTNVRLVAGETRREAIANLIAQNYLGWAYHASECEMFDDRPPPPKTRRRRRRKGEKEPPAAAAAPAAAKPE